MLKIPIAHAEGRYYADAQTLQALVDNDQILFKYAHEDGTVDEAANPNGSTWNIAGICNQQRNVFGMMPHPERASEERLGNTDGRILFESLADINLKLDFDLCDKPWQSKTFGSILLCL